MSPHPYVWIALCAMARQRTGGSFYSLHAGLTRLFAFMHIVGIPQSIKTATLFSRTPVQRLSPEGEQALYALLAKRQARSGEFTPTIGMPRLINMVTLPAVGRR